MLLQTLVQLNILILATPALAGWSVALPVHAGAFRTACIVWQYRTAETPAPKSEGQTLPAAIRQALPRPLSVSMRRPNTQKSVYPSVPIRAVASCHLFPHAIRAP